jgi:hypothetical protein
VECVIDGNEVCALNECMVVCALDDGLCLFIFLELHFLISNNPSFCQKHPGIPDGSDGSDWNYTLPVTQATGPSLLD